MTLDEAIKHAEEIACIQTRYAGAWDEANPNYPQGKQECKQSAEECRKCAAEHRQLAAWLRELKAYREKYPARSLEQYDGEGAE